MTTHTHKTTETKSNAAANSMTAQRSIGKNIFQSEDNRPETIAQRRIQETANNSPQVKQLKAIQHMANGHSLKTTHAYENKNTVFQKINMTAKEGELEANEKRGDIVTMYISMLFSQVGKARYSVFSTDSDITIIRNRDGGILTADQFLREFFGYDKNPDKTDKTPEELKKIREEFTARCVHDEKVKGKITLSEEPDIEGSFTALKACVITALMYVEGGSVMGASSVEELHMTLTTRFPETWGQYSDDNVIPSIYNYFGYKKKTVSGKRADVVKKSGYESGMVGSAGHMVGFKKVGEIYKFRDNESIESNADSHPKKNDTAIVIWHK